MMIIVINCYVFQFPDYLSPTIILPPGRLGELLDQAVISQHQGCFYYHKNGDCDNNLLENHHCNPSKIPNKPKILQPEHEDEVWCLAFSHSGKYLASGSKDSSIFLWTVMNEEVCIFFFKDLMIIYILTLITLL